MSATTTPDADPRAPWERFAWVMGAIWLPFLAFPLVAAVRSDHHVLARAAAVAAIAAFAVLYAYAFSAVTRYEDWHDAGRFGLRALGVLVALTVVVALVVGVTATGMTTFLLAFSMFSQPLARSYLLALGWVLVSAAVVAAAGGETSFFVVINVGVAVLTGIVRWIDHQQGGHDRLRRELAVVAERERVARDVHDVIGHSLTVVTVKAELAERLVDADPAAAKAELAQIRSLTREALAEIRATVAGLRVARLGDELAAARSALAGAGIAADVPADPNAVDPQHRLVLAWVLREAVTNVVRHSGARTCTVRLGRDRLEVVDDGVGIDGAAESTGLRGLRERVAAAGGTVTIGPADGGRDRPGAGPDRPGTRVEVRL
ncbi:sensor histidine kinase [Georgenia sp. TF02-10]|uniref:sensor histidine kinase n=1 Tax=Georgenia sp. TF02-10 TaxID=2917725 RepID=UPI001FA727C2|nr:sensor histidine kinase [Georgenia sp. TF02-10]UNX55772.1 sensor histidine kinase [Georgenia sp. TF02-10]